MDNSKLEQFYLALVVVLPLACPSLMALFTILNHQRDVSLIIFQPRVNLSTSLFHTCCDGNLARAFHELAKHHRPPLQEVKKRPFSNLIFRGEMIFHRAQTKLSH